MKNLRIDFCHPFKGSARLVQLSTKPQKSHIIKIDSKNSDLVEIPVDKCQEGKWKAILDWQYDDKSFSYEKEFEIKKKDNDFELIQ